MKNKSFDIANMPKYGYSSVALSKISKLALVGYEYTGTQSASNAVFLCAKSFSVRYFMVRLKGTRSRVPVTCITGRPTLSALPPKLLGRNTGRAFVINTGAH